MGISDDRREDWARWREGDSSALNRLLTSLEPFIMPTAARLTSLSGVPRSVVEAHVKRTAIDSLMSFNPDKGVKVETWVNRNLPKANRYIMDHMMAARLPEHRRLRVGTYQSVLGGLRTQLGREPTTHELQDELAWTTKEVSDMRRDLRVEVSAEAKPDYLELGPGPSQEAIMRDALSWLPYELDPEELRVYEGLTGFGGSERKTTKELGRELGKTSHEVRLLRESVANKVMARLELAVP